MIYGEHCHLIRSNTLTETPRVSRRFRGGSGHHNLISKIQCYQPNDIAMEVILKRTIGQRTLP
jgi:hypothetical protein